MRFLRRCGRAGRETQSFQGVMKMATQAVRCGDAGKLQESAAPRKKDWTRPQAIAIPREGYFALEKGRYGPTFPKTPACYGFTVVAKIIPGRELRR